LLGERVYSLVEFGSDGNTAFETLFLVNGIGPRADHEVVALGQILLKNSNLSIGHADGEIILSEDKSNGNSE
jgi:hypothetical protein